MLYFMWYKHFVKQVYEENHYSQVVLIKFSYLIVFFVNCIGMVQAPLMSGNPPIW